MITLENKNDIIGYAFEKVISFAWDNQYIFVVQCVRWLGLIISLQHELIMYIDNLQIYGDINRSVSASPRDIARDTSKLVDNQEDQILKSAELFLGNSTKIRQE